MVFSKYMTPAFSGGGFAMDVQNVSNQRELIRVFAEYRVVPKKNPMGATGMAKSQYILERRGKNIGGNKHVAGPETRKQLIRDLGITNDRDCERIREEIKNHPRWGKKA